MLGEVARGRDNNLNLIRVLAAFAVLVSHAHPIALGVGAQEPLSGALGISLGTLAVYVFFAISGFLIAASYANARSLTDWLLARALRIVPALFVVLALTVLLLGPAVTTLPYATYFEAFETIRYLPQNLLLYRQQYELPGVFQDHPMPGVINGSLWTLFYEVVCYAMVLVLGLSGALARKRVMLAVIAVYLAVYGAVMLEAVPVPYKVDKFVELALPFIIGVAFYIWRDRVALRWSIGLALAAIAFAAKASVLYIPLFVLALSYAVFVLAYRPAGVLRRYNALGDYSYGIYILAFPMQQLTVHVLGAHSPVQNIFYASIPTLALAVASWHLIEKPALSSRRRLAQTLRRDGVASRKLER